MPRLTKIESKPVIRWGLEWRSRSILDGEQRHIVMRSLVPALFRTRREARELQQAQYGYIGRRSDLRKEPFGWTVPVIVRIECRVIA